MDTHDHSHALRSRGFTVFEGVFPRPSVEALRGELVAIHDALGRPPLDTREDRELAPGIGLCAAGLAIRSLLTHRPAWAASLFHPDVVAAIRDVLGDDMTLEIAGAVISDHTRPFFAWHSHVGGVDDGVHWRRGEWPQVPEPERVMALLYLQDIDDDTGPLLVHPRAPGDVTGPPHGRELAEWPGQVELRPSAGSVVALEQRTWHAIRRMRGPGLRIFVGLTFAARRAAPGGFVDPALAHWRAPGTRMP